MTEAGPLPLQPASRQLDVVDANMEGFDDIHSHPNRASHLDFDLELVSPGALQLTGFLFEPLTDVSFLSSVGTDKASMATISEVGSVQILPQ
jgi:hypothetical protein